ncbi:MAG: hypothetical protein ACRCX2_20830 [Paraclostridium sp.]
MNGMIDQIRTINFSSLKSVKETMNTLKILKEEISNSEHFINLIKSISMNKEAIIACGFFFDIFNENESRDLWKYVSFLHFNSSALYELFRTINHKLFVEVLETEVMCSDFLDIFDMEFTLGNISSKVFEEDIVEYCDLVFRKIGIFNTEKFANAVSVEILNHRIDRTEYEFLKIKLLVILLETSELRNEIDSSIIRNHIDFTLNIIMMRLILDDLVIRKYKKEKNGQINHYFNIYFRLERMAKNYD